MEPETQQSANVAPPLPSTPWSWRLALGTFLVGAGVIAHLLESYLSARLQAFIGVLWMLALVALFSANLRAVKLRTLIAGVALQLFLAWFILRFEIYGFEWLDIPDGYAPGRALFESVGGVITQFMNFTLRGAEFVFGPLAKHHPSWGVIFAFAALPTIIFVSSFFTVLYFFGVLQWVVRVFARGMVSLLRTSGAETLSATANVFMGQTEAPLIVKPYVGRMTRSELLALMVGGMATISGGLMAVYISLGADAVSLLATSVMAAPCSLYLSKLMLPETEEPETMGVVRTNPEQPHRNAIDAAAAGASDGLYLALNVAAMLIAFLAFLALIDAVLFSLPTGRSLWDSLQPEPDVVGGYWVAAGQSLLVVAVFAVVAVLLLKMSRAWLSPQTREKFAALLWWTTPWGRLLILGVGLALFVLLLDVALLSLPEGLSLRVIFSWLFSPLAFFLGIQGDDIGRVADLLGTKLVSNEFVAYQELATHYQPMFSDRTRMIVTFALTGFANFGSIGIQLGGIGAMAPHRRADLARLGGRALFVGFLATLVNAAIAGMLLAD